VRPSESPEQLDATGFAVTDVFGLDGRRIEIADVDRAESSGGGYSVWRRMFRRVNGAGSEMYAVRIRRPV